MSERLLHWTGSATDRILECPASAAFPQVRTSSKASERGIFLHAYRERPPDERIHWLADQACKDTPDEWLEMARLTDALNLPELAAEVSFAYNAHDGSARELGRNLGRDYSSAAENEIPLTIDLVGVAGDECYVGDFKFGDSWQARPENDGQILLAALCAMRVYGKHACRVQKLVIRQHYESWMPEATVDLLDLEPLEQRMQSAWHAAFRARSLSRAGYMPVVSEGRHCTFCPAKEYCPAKTAIIVAAGRGKDFAQLAKDLVLVTDEDYAKAWELDKKLKAARSALKPRLIARAKERPFRTLDGKWVGEQEVEGNERLDGQKVFEALLKVTDEQTAIAATGRTATKAGIKKALKEKGYTPVAKYEREVLDHVRQNGGAHKPTKHDVVEYGDEK